LPAGVIPPRRVRLRFAVESRNLALALVIANMTPHDDQVLTAIFGDSVGLLSTASLPTLALTLERRA
jgi:hypothetical protein